MRKAKFRKNISLTTPVKTHTQTYHKRHTETLNRLNNKKGELIIESTNTNIKKLNWNDIDAYVNEPVYHKDEKYDGYRVVAGYKRYKFVAKTHRLAYGMKATFL